MKNIFKSRTINAVIISFSTIIITYIFSSIVVFQNLQLATVNWMFNLRGPVAAVDTSIVLVTIDDEALKSLPGKYPFPTDFYKILVENLNKAGARLLIFDIEFTEPNVVHPEQDLQFARAVNKAGNVILAGKIVFALGSYGIENPSILEPIDPLLRSQADWGLVNVFEDSDGFIRRYLIFYRMSQKTYHSLAIKAVKKLGQANIPPQNLYSSTFVIGDIQIPKSRESANSMYINFQGPPGTFRRYSMSSVLDDSTFDLIQGEDTNIFDLYQEWGVFKDKIVLIGASAEELQDNKYTPFYQYSGKKQKMPGVELHANALSTILNENFIRDIHPLAIFLMVIILACVTTWMTLIFKPFRTLGLVIIEIFLTLVFAFILFRQFRYILPITYPILSTTTAFLAATMYQTVSVQRERNRIRRTFQQYVAPAIVDKMLSTGDLPAYGGERKELTVFFSDIRQFTHFSESNEPEMVVSKLSEYLSEMVDVIFRYNGTLDKFVGDEIVALFGAPYYFTDHAERACRAALAMLKKLEKLSKSWPDSATNLFRIGIGINTGKVIVGNLGSQQLFDYTVIGDQVNLGARLEGANKEYNTTIILSENTYKNVKSKIYARELDIVRVVGRSRPVRIYELLGMDEMSQIEQDYLIKVFSDALAAYRERRWAEALKLFINVLRHFPEDGPSKVYIIRCLNYIETPPPSDWYGVYDFKTK